MQAQPRRILGLVFEIERAAGTASPAQLHCAPSPKRRQLLPLSKVREPQEVTVSGGAQQEQQEQGGGGGKLQYCAGFFDGLGHVFEDGPSYRLELTLPWEQREATLRHEFVS
eukprot:s5296_g6.t1